MMIVSYYLSLNKSPPSIIAKYIKSSVIIVYIILLNKYHLTSFLVFLSPRCH